jgi:acyl-CoA thioesterase
MEELMDYTKEAIERFQKDCFATEVVGIVIDKADIGYAKCHVDIIKKHHNAVGYVMGGVIFTLADFAFAVAANTGSPTTVTLTGNINFLSGTRANRLYAVAQCEKKGRSICFYNIIITDDEDNLVATISENGYIMADKNEKS